MQGLLTQGPGQPDGFELLRAAMVEKQLCARGIRDRRVLQAMASVPRHAFVPAELVARAYADEPLPIGQGQTISQPFIVAAMAEALGLAGGERVLEIGAGSGYLAAVLELLANQVIALETRQPLAAVCRERLARLGYANVRILEGDGSLGWPEGAPYDAIVVSAAAPGVPEPLFAQLAEGGRMVLPLGGAAQQEIVRLTKLQGRPQRETLFACRFVPLVGRHGWRESAKAAPTP